MELLTDGVELLSDGVELLSDGVELLTDGVDDQYTQTVKRKKICFEHDRTLH